VLSTWCPSGGRAWLHCVERTDLGRIMAFTDGVMAVAITLLVLNLEVPRVPGDELDEALMFLLSVPVAFLSPTAATLLWTATILLHFPLGRMGARGS
jgi:uncharacterized membrane protein